MNIAEEVKKCYRCDLHQALEYPCAPTPGDGPLDAQLMLIGEAPGDQEAQLGKPFQGMAGLTLDNILKESGIDRSTIYITNAVKCRPTKGKRNRPPTDSEIQICKKWLWQELKEVDPKIIVLLGKIPTYSVLNAQLNKTFTLKSIFGKQFTTSYCRSIFIPCYHPSYLMQHGKDQMEIVIELFRGIKNEL
jgi:uracil-DNA glycosylase family 4